MSRSATHHPVAASIGLALCMAMALTVLSGCSESPQCRYRLEDSEALMQAFLVSAAAGDKTAAAALLNPGWRVDHATFDALTSRLAGVDLAVVRLVPDQLGAMIHYDVFDAGGSVGGFDVLEEGGCAGISWGDYPEPSEEIDPAVSPTAAAIGAAKVHW